MIWAVIDEAVLHRPVGGAEVHSEQLQHLVKMAQLPHVTIQVLPYTAGAVAAAGSAFSILRFPEPQLPDIVYLEQLSSALYLERPQDLALYLSVMDRVSVQALRPDQSRDLLTRYAERA